MHAGHRHPGADAEANLPSPASRSVLAARRPECCSVVCCLPPGRTARRSSAIGEALSALATASIVCSADTAPCASRHAWLAAPRMIPAERMPTASRRSWRERTDCSRPVPLIRGRNTLSRSLGCARNCIEGVEFGLRATLRLGAASPGLLQPGFERATHVLLAATLVEQGEKSTAINVMREDCVRGKRDTSPNRDADGATSALQGAAAPCTRRCASGIWRCLRRPMMTHIGSKPSGNPSTQTFRCRRTCWSPSRRDRPKRARCTGCCHGSGGSRRPSARPCRRRSWIDRFDHGRTPAGTAWRSPAELRANDGQTPGDAPGATPCRRATSPKKRKKVGGATLTVLHADRTIRGQQHVSVAARREQHGACASHGLGTSSRCI